MKPKIKIKAKVPYFIYNVLEHDLKKFDIKLNTLLNIIFTRVIHEKNQYNYQLFNEIVDSRRENNKIIHFKLNKTNQQVFESLQNNYITADTSEAIFLRSLLYTYINHHVNEREKFIHFHNFNTLEKAIKQKIMISIKYKDKTRKIEPFFILATEEERFNYICCYCHTKKDIINYRLSNICDIVTLPNNLQLNRDNYDIKKLKNNFDPYLSNDKFVTIKLTTIGKKYYKLFTYKPPIVTLDNGKKISTKTSQKEITDKLNRDGDDIFTLEASIFKAKLFLGAFWEEVEVIEPIELRDWVEERAKKMVGVYGEKK